MLFVITRYLCSYFIVDCRLDRSSYDTCIIFDIGGVHWQYAWLSVWRCWYCYRCRRYVVLDISCTHFVVRVTEWLDFLAFATFEVIANIRELAQQFKYAHTYCYNENALNDADGDKGILNEVLGAVEAIRQRRFSWAAAFGLRQWRCRCGQRNGQAVRFVWRALRERGLDGASCAVVFVRSATRLAGKVTWTTEILLRCARLARWRVWHGCSMVRALRAGRVATTLE